MRQVRIKPAAEERLADRFLRRLAELEALLDRARDELVGIERDARAAGYSLPIAVVQLARARAEALVGTARTFARTLSHDRVQYALDLTPAAAADDRAAARGVDPDGQARR